MNWYMTSNYYIIKAHAADKKSEAWAFLYIGNTNKAEYQGSPCRFTALR